MAKIVGSEDIPTGHSVILSASFEKTGLERDHAAGILSLYHGDRKVGEAQIKTQLGALAIAGASLYVGRHPGEPVTDDYPGQPPHAFTGGTIDRVVIDVGSPLTEHAGTLGVISPSHCSRSLHEVGEGVSSARGLFRYW